MENLYKQGVLSLVFLLIYIPELCHQSYAKKQVQHLFSQEDLEKSFSTFLYACYFELYVIRIQDFEEYGLQTK